MPTRLTEKTIKITCPHCNRQLIVDHLVEAEYQGWDYDVCPECVKERKKNVKPDKGLQGQRNGNVS